MTATATPRHRRSQHKLIQSASFTTQLTLHPLASSSATSSSSSTTPTASNSTDSNLESQSSLIKILSLEELDPNLYRGFSPSFPRYGRVYGGQTVAQALVAAGKTVQPQYIVHSLHSYFIRPGSDDLPILYQVDRARDGQSFCTRRIAGIQRGKTIFTMEVSFQTLEVGLSHQYIAPKVPLPDDVEDWNVVRHRYADDPRFVPSFRKLARVALQLPFQMDLRRISPSNMDEFLTPNQPARQYMWMRVRGKLGDNNTIHQTALAYMSDFALLETSVIAHATHWASATRSGGQKIQPASLDHSMWFHDHAVRADEWLLYECESPAASGGRGFNIGRFYTLDGKLIVSCAQEGLIRVKDWEDDLDPRIRYVENPTKQHQHVVTTKNPQIQPKSKL